MVFIIFVRLNGVLTMNIQELRNMFPALSRTVYGKPLVYFDNAATAQRPQTVIDKWTALAIGANANIHRAVHKLAVDATEEYENTRDAVKDYLNAASREEVIFTSGTTGSINLVAFSFGETFVHDGDEIIVSESEHHSNIVPWQMLCQRKGAVLRVLHVDEDGHLNLEELKSLLNPKTRIVAVTQISNVLGILNPIKEIVSVCHSVGCPVLIDGAQGMVHEGVDVQDVDCDFYAFSGHKLYAATGTGVLYGKRKWLDQMVPYQGGGEMIATVRFSGTLADALRGADIFVGVSAPNIVTPEMVSSMNKDAILFAMANPVPEIMPDVAKAAGAKVVGTGRSDFPNQVNNVIAFPGIFRGALEAHATQITEEMKLAAAEALAALVSDEELNEDFIMPEAFDPRVAEVVSEAVKSHVR